MDSWRAPEGRADRGSVFAWGVGAVVTLAAFVFATKPQASAQVVEFATPADAASTDNKDVNRAFILPAQPPDVTEAIEDFIRYKKKETWEKAFKALEKVTSTAPKGLVARPDGILVPARLLVRQALAELPPAGKNAYRVFHDADAKNLLDQAQGAFEFDNLTKLVTTHLVTSSGDIAADRLGEFYFEQGDMNAAIDSWRSILLYRPDSGLSRGQILLKTGIALVRAGRIAEARDVQQQLSERHGDETIVLGGRKVVAAQHLANLLKQAPSEVQSASVANAELPDIQLPPEKSNEPAWQFSLSRSYEGPDGNAVQKPLLFLDPNYGQTTIADMVMPVAADDKRVYANLLGYNFAVDLETGKLAWRSANFLELSKKVRQNPYILPEQYSISVVGDRLYSVLRPVEQIGQHGQAFQLVAREAATGKEVFNSKTAGEFSTWSVAGKPVVTHDGIYAAGYKNNQATELFVLAFNPKDNKVRWSTSIGNHKQDQNQLYYMRTAQPSLMLRGQKLYVDTHAGAFAELDTRTGNMNWAYAYDTDAPDNQYRYNRGYQLITIGHPQFVGGNLLFKGMRSERLVAIDPSGPLPAWTRPVSQSQLFIGADDERFYMAGEELTAYDIRTRKLLWAARVPISTGWIRPLMTKSRIYQFTPRGIFEFNKANGKIVRLYRGADMESLGGALLLTPKVLLSVSNLGITAYQVERGTATADRPPENLSSK